MSNHFVTHCSLIQAVSCQIFCYSIITNAMVSNGIQWYPIVPIGMVWILMVISSTEWYLMVPNGTKWCSMVPISAQWYLIVPDGTKWYGSKWCGTVQNGTKQYQNRTKRYHKRQQTALNNAEHCQTLPNSANAANCF